MAGTNEEGFGWDNPAEESAETPAQEASEESQTAASGDIPHTETEAHVSGLMAAAHAQREALVEHGRSAVQAGP
jgi:hypothetical protein